jgi:hypothetical protein
MPAVRPVTLIAIVTLTMGLALVVSGEAQQKNAAAAFEGCGITKTPTQPFVPPSPYPAKTHSDYFGLARTNCGRNCARTGHGRVYHNGPTAPFGRRSSGSARAIVGIAIRSQDWRSPGNVWMCRQVPRSNCLMLPATAGPTIHSERTGHYKDGELSFVVWVTE